MSKAYKPKSFWRKPEGIVGVLFLLGLIGGAGFLISTALSFFFTNVGMIISLVILGLVIFTALDSKARTLMSYMYQSSMRWITGIFIQIDPIGILKSYVDDLSQNLKKMSKQINRLRGQMHMLQEMIFNNKKDIQQNIAMAGAARDNAQKKVMILKSRKAGRLKESNLRLEDLYKKMEVMYRVLAKMYENSSILIEDIDDQVKVKEQERKVMMAGHSAMKSAMSILKGDSDKRAIFDQALEAVADDVSQKVGEMERFMEMSESFMQSVDLQNGIFEEEGMKMLEKWEMEGDSLLLGDAKEELILLAESDHDILSLNDPIKQTQSHSSGNQYDDFFD